MDTRLHDGGLFMQKLSELTMAKPEAAVQAGSHCSSAMVHGVFFLGEVTPPPKRINRFLTCSFVSRGEGGHPTAIRDTTKKRVYF